MKTHRILLVFVASLLFAGCMTSREYSTKEVNLFGEETADIVIENPYPYQGPVYVMGEIVGDVSPGGTLYDSELVPFRGMHLPAIVVLYDGPRCVGMTSNIFTLYPNRSSVWRVRNVEWITNERPDFSRSSTVAGGGSRKVELPRPFVEKTTMLQFGNVTPYTAVIELNGKPVKKLEPCDVHYEEGKTFGNSRGFRSGGEVTVTMKFLKDGKVIGLSPQKEVSYARTKPKAYQFIYGPRDIDFLEGYDN